MIHPNKNTFVHCFTIDNYIIAIPARSIQYHLRGFMPALNGHWDTYFSANQVLEMIKAAFIIYKEEETNNPKVTVND